MKVIILALVVILAVSRPNKKAYLHPRAVNCYDDDKYRDDYGQCICEEDMWK